MRVAMPVCAEEIATTTDFARELLVADCEGSQEVQRSRFLVEESLPANRARRIAGLGIQVLICGAISRALATLIQDSGIHIIPLVSGSVNSVLESFLTGRLDEDRFLLPGCTADDRRRLIRGADTQKGRTLSRMRQ